MRKLLVILMIMFLCIIGCSVKRKTKEVERIEIVSETQLSNDSVVDIKAHRSSYDWLNNYTLNENLLSKIGLVFNGTTNDDKGSFSIHETDKGLQVDIQGALQMALDKTSSIEKTLTKQETIMLFDSILKANLQQNKTERSDQLLDSFKSETQKEKTDISFWIYAVIGLVLVVGIVIYIIIKQLKGGK